MQRSIRLPLAGVFVAMLLGGSVLVAQQSSPPPPERGERRDPQEPPRDQQRDQQSEEGFRFRTGVELINVSATVTDTSGRFVPNLRKEDFIVYEDGQEQTITHFNAERVPVSLGIALDTSGSMAGDKFEHAQAALDRFLFDLLDDKDEVFLVRFSTDAYLEQGWTTDKGRISRALRRIVPRGGTAMNDAVAEAVPLADKGSNRKKAVLVISDGNDTNSETHISEVKQLVRQTEVLVYAIGIDGQGEITGAYRPPIIRPRPPVQGPFPFPIPRRGRPWPAPPGGGGGGGGGSQGTWQRQEDRVNVAALRSLTDDSGGRTEIVRSSRDLGPATQSIADELSQQYFFAYPAASKKDGRWHEIRVELRDKHYQVRARRGYMAS
jgi:Ca-activated chloride channel homolog